MKKQLRAGGRMKRNYFTYYYNLLVHALQFEHSLFHYYNHGDGIFGAR